jgi:hypothetical protein
MNREEVKPYVVIENSAGITAYVRGRAFSKTGVRVYINHNSCIIPVVELHDWNMANPIRENRIVSDYTFAVRFKQFLKWIPKEWWMSQPHYYDEFNYMCNVADILLKYQIKTATDSNEINYFKGLNLI